MNYAEADVRRVVQLDPAERIQAPSVAAWRSRHTTRLRQGLALSYYSEVSRRILIAGRAVYRSKRR